MTLYQWLLLVHILFAMIWVGGSILDLALARRFQRAPDAVRAEFDEAREQVDNRVFPVALIGMLIFGVLLVFQSDAWSFSMTWVWLSLALVLLLLALGIGFHAPQGKRLVELRSERGVSDPEYQSLYQRVDRAIQIETVISVLIVFLMIFKPGA